MTIYFKGIFGMCWRLVLDGKMSEDDANQFKAVERWFADNLPEPEQCKNQEKSYNLFQNRRC